MKISQQTKEIINMVLFVIVVAALVIVYIVYPLGRTKAIMGRVGLDDYDEDSTIANDAAAWVEAELAQDTFRVEADGLTTLAGLYLRPDSGVADSARGTVCLIHGDDDDRDAMIPLARRFVDSGFAVVAYDQRAAGRSSGSYHGVGQYEASDFQALVSYLELRQRIIHPLVAVGFTLGGDAALLATAEDKRIDRVVAIDPYLTTRRMQDILRKRHDAYWFPFYRTIMWWWYDMRSSYAASYRDYDDIKAVACPTLLLISADASDDREVQRLADLSDPALLEMKTTPDGNDQLFTEILSFMSTGE